MAAPSSPRSPRLAPGRPFARAARLWWRNVLAFTLIAGLLGAGAVVLEQASVADDALAFLALQLFYVVAGAMAEGAITFGALRDLAGERVGPLRMLAAASERYGRLLAVSALCSVLILGGLMLLVVPGLLAMAVTFVALPIAVAEPQLPIPEVFRRSWELSRGRRRWLVALSGGVLGFQFGVSRGIDQLARVLHGLPAWAPSAAKAVVGSLLEGLVCSLAVVLCVAFAATPPPEPAAWEP